jgi:hypothetical protein
VFNFFRPGYSPPNTRMGNQNLVVPEYQLVDEVSVAGYLNTMQTAINSGVGASNDIATSYPNELAVASDATALTARINLLLLYGQMSSGLQSKIIAAVNAVTIPGATSTQAQITAAQLNRAKLAIFMTMASPEYITQR